MPGTIITQFAQVFIHYFSNKTRSTTKLFISEPAKSVERQGGRIFGIIEIHTPSRENSKIINHLIADLEESYYNYIDEGLEASEAFEKTLKKVNNDFISMLNEDSVLVGNLNEYTIREKINLLIGVVKDTDLHLTALNNIGAYLFHRTNQGYRTVEILGERESQDESEDLKLFTNVISGKLTPSDYLFFCNNDFLNFISTERISKTITSLPPHKASDYFKNSLLQYEGFNFAAVIVRTTEPESENGSVPQSLSSIDMLNRRESSTEQLLSPSFMPNISSIGRSLMSKFKSSKKPAAKDTQEDEKINKEDVAPVKTSTVVKTAVISDAAKKVAKTTFNSTSHALNKWKASLRLNDNFQSFKNIIRLRYNQLKLKLKKIPNLSKILLSVFLIVAILFGYSVVFVKQKNFRIFQQDQANAAITELDSRLDEAEAKLISGNDEESRLILSQIETEISELTVQSSADQQKLRNIVSRLDRLVAQLRNITIVNDPTELITLEGSAEGRIPALAYFDNTVYIFDDQNSSVIALDTRSREQRTLTGNFEGSSKSAHVTDGRVLFLTDSNRFYSIDNGAIRQVSVSLQNSDIVSDFAFYNNAIYNVIPGKNQIYRHSSQGEGFGPGVTWIQESGITLPGVHSIGIDTGIWLANNSTVLRFFKGAKQAFSITGVEPEIESVTSMVKKEESSNIYLLEPSQKRLVVLDTDGRLVTQYFSENFSSLSSMAIDEAGKVAYIADGNRIFAIILSHL